MMPSVMPLTDKFNLILYKGRLTLSYLLHIIPLFCFTLWSVTDITIQHCIYVRVTLATLLLLDQFELVFKDCWLNRLVSVQVHANVFQRELSLPGC